MDGIISVANPHHQASQTPAMVLTSGSERRTELIGRAIGEALRVGDVVLLSGELGAGKTRMTSGIAEGTGSATSARSPTFVIVNEYRGRIRLSHCDLYRVGGVDEVEELALEERLTDGALVIEWPERGLSALPGDALVVQIAVDPETEERTIFFTPEGSRSAHLIARAAAIYESLDAANALLEGDDL